MRIACSTALAAFAALAASAAFMAPLAAASAGAQPAALAFAPCDKSQAPPHAPAFQCATLRVPLDRANPAAGSIALAVQRIPASGPRAGAIVLLAGGPGQAAIPPWEERIAPLSSLPALRDYELVTFDQRGTGQSGELQCNSSSPEQGRGSLVEECGLALGAARADYTSQDSVEDLDGLRQALGGAPLSLLAVSYGGRVAGMYAHEHPDDVARMVLDSPSRIVGDDALDTQRLRALPRVLDQSICAAGACRSFTADAYADLARLAAKLRRRPMDATVVNQDGVPGQVYLSEQGLLRLVGELDLPGGLRRLFPAAVAAADHGHPGPLGRLSVGLSQVTVGGISEALYLATYCVENQMPWSPLSPTAGRPATLEAWLAGVAPATAAPFALPTVAASSAISLCVGWPPTPPAPAPPGGISPVPTLILSGEDDLRTPLEQSLGITSGYSDVQLLRIPATGHSTFSTDRSGCAARAMVGFLTGGQAPSSCPAPSGPSALPLPPASLAAVAPARSSNPLAGRAAAAAALTIGELIEPPGEAGGGLRGGSWRLRGDDLVMRRTVDVAGVSVSGTIGLLGTPRGRIVLAGRVHGTLRLAGYTLSGRLDGARVRARVTPP